MRLFACGSQNEILLSSREKWSNKQLHAKDGSFNQEKWKKLSSKAFYYSFSDWEVNICTHGIFGNI